MIKIQETHDEVIYILPQEGALLWGQKSGRISAKSQQKEISEKFINYLLRPEINALVVKENYIATPNAAGFTFHRPGNIK